MPEGRPNPRVRLTSRGSEHPPDIIQATRAILRCLGNPFFLFRLNNKCPLATQFHWNKKHTLTSSRPVAIHFHCFFMDSERAKSVFSEKGSLYEKETRKIGKKYDDWYEKRPSFIVSHGDMSGYEFLKSLSDKYAPSTLWTKFSYLKGYFDLKYSLSDNTSYKVTTEYLKKLSRNYTPDKAHLFEIHGDRGIMKYWKQEPENNQILLFQVMSLTAVFAAHRSCEVSKMLVSDVNIVPESKYVEITSNRSKGTKRLQAHIIPSSEKFDSVKLFKLYLERAHPNLDPSARLFRNIHSRSGEFFASPCGKNHWTKCARKIAEFLGFSAEEVMEFSSHSFRSTSATAMAENGASIEQLKLHGNWESTTVLTGYIRETKRFREENAEKIIAKRPSPSSSSSSSSSSLSAIMERPQSENGENLLKCDENSKGKEEVVENPSSICFGSGCNITNSKIIVKIQK